MKIAIYSRKSKFTGKGESIENQIQLCKEYVSRNLDCSEGTIIDVYEDEGFSGKDTARPQFQEMMAKVRQKLYDYIICYRLDRISRNVSDFSSLIDEMQQYKTSFICIREQFDTSTPMGRAMMYIASVFAQLERETIAERIRDNMLLLARTGRWLGGNTPLGFASIQIHKEDAANEKVKTAFKLKPIPEEIEIVKHIYDKYLELRSMAKIERQLIKHDIKTRKGKYFTSLAIRDILNNPVYCVADKVAYNYFQKLGSDICFDKKAFDGKHGVAAYNRTSHDREGQTRNDPSDWIVSIGNHKGIIDGERWTRVQLILKSNKHGLTHKRVRNPVSLLSGMLVCEICGFKMRPRINSNKEVGIDGARTFSYLCDLKKRSKGQKCNCENLNGNEADQAVYSVILNQCRTRADITDKILNLKSNAVDHRKAPLQMASAIQAKIQDKKDRIQSLILILARDSSNTALHKYTGHEVKRLDQELKLLDEQLLYLEKEQENAKESRHDVTAMEERLKTAADAFLRCPIHEKRELLASLVDRITWNGAQVHVYMLGSRHEIPAQIFNSDELNVIETPP